MVLADPNQLWLTEDALRVRLNYLAHSEADALEYRLAFRDQCEEAT